MSLESEQRHEALRKWKQDLIMREPFDEPAPQEKSADVSFEPDLYDPARDNYYRGHDAAEAWLLKNSWFQPTPANVSKICDALSSRGWAATEKNLNFVAAYLRPGGGLDA